MADETRTPGPMGGLRNKKNKTNREIGAEENRNKKIKKKENLTTIKLKTVFLKVVWVKVEKYLMK